VFTASSFSIGNGHTVTINGTASDFVAIDITGSSGNKLDGALTLTGGITSDHVLINFIGSGANVQGAANGATLFGTFLIPNLGVNLASVTINGHLFGGAAGKDFQFVSNTFISQPLTQVVPEPSSLLLLGFGLAGFAYWRRRKME
jgi:PEP-CTERM motif-containing protein